MLYGVGQETVVETIVSIDNANYRIKPGFTAKAKIITEKNDNVLLVPYEAVRAENNGEEYVYTYVDGKALKTPIDTGKEYENGFEVLDGLEKGDKVISTPDLVEDRCV